MRTLIIALVLGFVLIGHGIKQAGENNLSGAARATSSAIQAFKVGVQAGNCGIRIDGAEIRCS